ncbi:Thioesterase type II [gamma proteobacterium HdN1]|nr:Thioesterase type II [gamma proteobacterium HdN1]
MGAQRLLNDISRDKWFQVPKPNGTANARLFCFSYAGGNASAYREWYKYLPEGVELCNIQLPGRGSRFKEASYTSLNTLLDGLETAIVPYLDKNFSFFGHSMGAQVAFELARRLQSKGQSTPDYLFVSARKAPQIPLKRRPLHQLSEKEFRSEIERLNGTPKEALENPELMDLISPILRADCKAVETWDYHPSEPLNIPIVALGGVLDQHVSIDELEKWADVTKGPFEIQLFSGDHFYIHQATDALMNMVSRKLSRILSFGNRCVRNRLERSLER